MTCGWTLLQLRPRFAPQGCCDITRHARMPDARDAPYFPLRPSRQAAISTVRKLWVVSFAAEAPSPSPINDNAYHQGLARSPFVAHACGIWTIATSLNSPTPERPSPFTHVSARPILHPAPCSYRGNQKRYLEEMRGQFPFHERPSYVREVRQGCSNGFGLPTTDAQVLLDPSRIPPSRSSA
jgi:hypothetical protein